jgi:hypothetical protein
MEGIFNAGYLPQGLRIGIDKDRPVPAIVAEIRRGIGGGDIRIALGQGKKRRVLRDEAAFGLESRGRCRRCGRRLFALQLLCFQFGGTLRA